MISFIYAVFCAVPKMVPKNPGVLGTTLGLIMSIGGRDKKGQGGDIEEGIVIKQVDLYPKIDVPGYENPYKDLDHNPTLEI